MKDWSKNWVSSKKPRKQRKYRYKAPLHIKQKFVDVHLSAELRKKYGRRSLQVRKGDKVKIMVGQFKKKTGKVERVDLKKEKVYIEGIENIKKDGSKSLYPIHPSNLMLMEPILEDKARKKKLGGEKEKK